MRTQLPLSIQGLLGAAVAVAAVASLRCGTNLFYVEVEESQLCKTVTNQSFPADPISTPQSFSQAFDYNFGSQLSAVTNSRVVTEAKVASVTFTANQGVTDLGFIDSAKMELIDPGAQVDGGVAADAGTAEPPVTLVSYQKAPGATPSASVTLTGTGQLLDLNKYLQSGRLRVSATLAGTFPPNTWSLDIKVCIGFKARYNYL